VLLLVLAAPLKVAAQFDIDADSGARMFIGVTYVEPPYTISVVERIVLVNEFVAIDFGELPDPFDPGSASTSERKERWAATGGWIYARLVDGGATSESALDSVEVFLRSVVGFEIMPRIAGSTFELGSADSEFHVYYEPSTHTPAHAASDRERRAAAPLQRAASLAETLGFRYVYFLNRGSGVGIPSRTGEERDQLTSEATAFLAGDLPDWEHAKTLKNYLASFERNPMHLQTLSEWRSQNE